MGVLSERAIGRWNVHAGGGGLGPASAERDSPIYDTS